MAAKIVTRALLLACCAGGICVSQGSESASAQREPGGRIAPDEAWADHLRSEAIAAVPGHERIASEAAALFEDGWDPFYAFPPITLERGEVTGFDWQSSSWRSATFESWLSGKPTWRPIFALATLNEREGRRFGPRPWNNLNCHGGSISRCLIAVTEGGFDEVRWLEIDSQTHAVPADAFDLSPARSSVAWLNGNALLVASAQSDEPAGGSGFPLTAKVWRRGQSLREAEVVYRARAGAAMVAVDSFPAEKGRIGVIQVYQGIRPTKLLVLGDSDRALDLGLPPGSVVNGVVAGRLIVSLLEGWRKGADAWPSGSLVAFDVASLREGKVQRPSTVFRAGGGHAVEIAITSRSVLVAADAAYLAILGDGTRKLYRATPAGRNWKVEPLIADPAKVVKLVTADAAGTAGLASTESMIDPPALYRIDGAELRRLREAKSFFDGSGLQMERRFARASDGMRIPYWLVRKKDAKGPLPTILHGYGASNIPVLPLYAADVGRLWLEKGGAYAIAQVRGGGEFGPAWAKAGQDMNRGRPVRDFIAVAEDLIGRRVTDKKRLGADGLSDGGRLVAAAATLRPDLFAAVVSRDGPVFPEANVGLAASPVMAEDLKLLETPAGRALADSYWPNRVFAKRRACPNLLLTSWRGDQRVSARQSRALAALFRENGCRVLLYEQPGGEHGATSPEMLGVIYGFFKSLLGLNTGERAPG